MVREKAPGGDFVVVVTAEALKAIKKLRIYIKRSPNIHLQKAIKKRPPVYYYRFLVRIKHYNGELLEAWLPA